MEEDVLRAALVEVVVLLGVHRPQDSLQRAEGGDPAQHPGPSRAHVLGTGEGVGRHHADHGPGGDADPVGGGFVRAGGGGKGESEPDPVDPAEHHEPHPPRLVVVDAPLLGDRLHPRPGEERAVHVPQGMSLGIGEEQGPRDRGRVLHAGVGDPLALQAGAGGLQIRHGNEEARPVLDPVVVAAVEKHEPGPSGVEHRPARGRILGEHGETEIVAIEPVEGAEVPGPDHHRGLGEGVARGSEEHGSEESGADEGRDAHGDLPVGPSTVDHRGRADKEPARSGAGRDPAAAGGCARRGRPPVARARTRSGR